eukprot:216575-Pleurochrysis_carterae.AAC.1
MVAAPTLRLGQPMKKRWIPAPAKPRSVMTGSCEHCMVMCLQCRLSAELISSWTVSMVSTSMSAGVRQTTRVMLIGGALGV